MSARAVPRAALNLGRLGGMGIFTQQGFFSRLIHDALTSLSIWEY